MIHLLWEEARVEYSPKEMDDRLIQKRNKLEMKNQPSYDSVDLEKRNATEEGGDKNDLIELGILKLCLYSLQSGLPRGFPMRCLPCVSSSKTSISSFKDEKMKIKRSGGELISHDASTCSICRGSVGCPECSTVEMESYDDDLLLVEEHQKRPVENRGPTKAQPKRPVEKKSSSSPKLSSKIDDDDEIVEIVLNRRSPTK
jgi:hypothetical protein